MHPLLGDLRVTQGAAACGARGASSRVETGSFNAAAASLLSIGLLCTSYPQKNPRVIL